MKNSIYKPLILMAFLGATPVFSALARAAPTQQPAAVAADAAAVKILDQSVAAYEALDHLSLQFAIAYERDGKAQPKRAGRGQLIIQGEEQARLEGNFGDSQVLYVANGDLMNVQNEPTKYYEVRGDEEDFVYTIVSMLDEALADLMTGDNTLALESGFGWKSIEIVPDKNFDCVRLRQKFTPTTYRIYFDKITHLIGRIETETESPRPLEKKSSIEKTTLTLKTFAAPITPATFVFTPTAGDELVTHADESKFYDERLVVGAKPFDFTGKTLDGKTISLADYKGKVVLLDFWATWCGPCIAELPIIEANYHKYHARGFDVIAISADIDEQILRDYVKTHALPWPQIFDSDFKTSVIQTYGVSAFPTSFLIGKDGVIVAIDPQSDELEPAIQAALEK